MSITCGLDLPLKYRTKWMGVILCNASIDSNATRVSCCLPTVVLAEKGRYEPSLSEWRDGCWIQPTEPNQHEVRYQKWTCSKQNRPTYQPNCYQWETDWRWERHANSHLSNTRTNTSISALFCVRENKDATWETQRGLLLSTAEPTYQSNSIPAIILSVVIHHRPMKKTR